MDALNFLAQKEEMEKEINDLKAQIVEKQRSLSSLVAFQNKHSLTNQEVSRYSRQILLPNIGVHGQEKLKNGSVLIIGCGGLGCPAAQYLAGCGVGRLGLVDYDDVEENNLHRQILHREESIGKPKVQSAAEALKRLNNQIQIEEYPVQLNSLNALQIMQSYSVVIDASDNPATRYLVNDACVLSKLPLVSGSAVGMEGQLTVYNFSGGPCYRCLYPVPTPPQMVTNCGDAGVLGPIPGVIGVLQALQAVHILLGSEGILNQKLVLFDGMDCQFRQVKLRGRSRECSVCGENPSITRLVDYEQFCRAPANDKMNKKATKRHFNFEEGALPAVGLAGDSESFPDAGPSKKVKDKDESEKIEVLIGEELVEILLESDLEDEPREEDFPSEDESEDMGTMTYPGVPISNLAMAPPQPSTSPDLSDTVKLPASKQPIDFFLHIFTDKFFDLIIRETNFQGILLMSQGTKPKSRIQGWKPLTKEELQIFLGLIFLSGHFNAPSLCHYWQANGLYNFPVFRNAMSRDRFLLILRTLYFAGNPQIGDPKPSDPLYKISPLFDLFHERMREIYSPSNELSLDESMFLWRGRLYFRQYIQNNNHKFGLKFYMLSRLDGLILKTRLYYGANNPLLGGSGHVDRVLEDLLDEYFGVGHTVYMDNLYSSEELSDYLLEKNTDSLQTFRANRKGNYLDFNKKLKKGHLTSGYSSVGIRVLKWHEKQDRIPLDFDTASHPNLPRDDDSTDNQETILKYNEFMGGTDRSELFMSYDTSERKTLRWYVKVALHLFHIIMCNAFTLYRAQPEKGNSRLLDFRESVINELIYRNRPTCSPPPQVQSSGIHVLSQVPRNDKNRLIRKRCVFCSKNKKRMETAYFCEDCKGKPGLCIDPCFRMHHGY